MRRYPIIRSGPQSPSCGPDLPMGNRAAYAGKAHRRAGAVGKPSMPENTKLSSVWRAGQESPAAWCRARRAATGRCRRPVRSPWSRKTAECSLPNWTRAGDRGPRVPRRVWRPRGARGHDYGPRERGVDAEEAGDDPAERVLRGDGVAFTVARVTSMNLRKSFRGEPRRAGP